MKSSVIIPSGLKNKHVAFDLYLFTQMQSVLIVIPTPFTGRTNETLLVGISQINDRENPLVSHNQNF